MTEFNHLPLLAAVEFCYTDDVRFIDDQIAVDILTAANKLCIGRLKVKVASYIADGVNWDNLIQVFKFSTTADVESLNVYCSFYIVRMYDKIKAHKDFGLLTDSEKHIFTEQRKNWKHISIQDYEEYWYNELEGKGKEGAETVNEIIKSKKCIVM